MIWEKIRLLFREAERAEDAFKEEWMDLLVANVPLYSKIPEDLKLRLHERIAAFVGSTRFEGCNGLELDDEMILTGSAQACMLVLNREGFRKQPELYDELKAFYGVDPQEWFA